MEMAGMSEAMTFPEIFAKELLNKRKRSLRHICYTVGDNIREGYVEVDDLEADFIPIRASVRPGAQVNYVNRRFMVEYGMRRLIDEEQRRWEETVDYEESCT